MPAILRSSILLVSSLALATNAVPQTTHDPLSGPAAPQAITDTLRDLVETPAVPGYEQEVGNKIGARIKAMAPEHAAKPTYTTRTDGMGNVTVTIGSGTPHRLVVAPMDEPGFVVGGITPEGYLTLQRLPQGGNLPLFNELYAAQSVKIGTAGHTWINGAVAGINLHLLPQRQHPPSMADLDNMYVDVGAATAAQARSGGADVLSPVAIDRKFLSMGSSRCTAAGIGDRFGDAVLLDLLRNLNPAKIQGTLTVAFVAQQWLGARGLQRVIEAAKPDELIYVGRLMRPAPTPANASATAAEGQRETSIPFTKPLGSGVLFAEEKPAPEARGLSGELLAIADREHITHDFEISAPLLPRAGYLPQPKLPDRTVHLAIATAWPSTPAEVVDGNDLVSLSSLLQLYLQGSRQKSLLTTFVPAEPAAPDKQDRAPSAESILKQLVETYGVSGGYEANVREAVAQLLPAWAKPEADNAGNLMLRWPGSANSKAPRIAVVAHMDEIGYEVHALLPDGKLELEQKGGHVPAYFLGHAALVHSGKNMHPGVMELPEGWEKSDFQWPRNPRMTYRMDVGAHSAEEAAQLGIKVGDFVTIPKQYHKLLGARASARAFDDRVGCAALVAAAWALGPNLNGRDITFIWSTSEELGLEGASAAAKSLAAQGRAPDYVFAVDTFVSSDSPLESRRFADAPLGQGFVVRAVDNSNIVPRNLAERVVSIARASNISAQYGVTGGGNDGSAFLLYGSTDVALGWPLRYSHSPAEVIDVRDLDALARIVAALAKSW